MFDDLFVDLGLGFGLKLGGFFKLKDDLINLISVGLEIFSLFYNLIVFIELEEIFEKVE